MAADTLLYKIPEQFAAAYDNGSIELFNAILKDKATGKIVGHIQETDVMGKIFGAASDGLFNTVSGGFNPLSLVSTIQNQTMIGQLTKIQSSLGLLTNLQYGGLALSGVNLGVSAVGFAMMMKRLDAISGRMDDLGAQVEKVTSDRREDELKALLARMRSLLANIDTLRTRRNPVPVAQNLQLGLDEVAAQLVQTLQRVLRQKELAEADLDLMWTIAGAIRLCHDAGENALFVAEELETSVARATQNAQIMVSLASGLSSDALARKASMNEENRVEARRALLPQSTTLVSGVHDSIATLTGQASIGRSLIDHGWSGREYLDRLAAEEDEPLLFLPAA